MVKLPDMEDSPRGGTDGAQRGYAHARQQTLSSGNLGDATGAIENLPPEGSSTPATLNVIDSTVAGNQGGTTGGGILSRESTLSTGALAVNVINSTIADNVSTDRGGGLALQKPTNASIVNSTITANSTHIVGGGLDVEEGATALLQNTIIAGNSGGANQTQPDCAGGPRRRCSTAPAAHNLIGVGSGCGGLVNGVDGDQRRHDRRARSTRCSGSLGYDGGTTRTAPPLPASPAIGAGDATICETAPVARPRSARAVAQRRRTGRLRSSAPIRHRRQRPRRRSARSRPRASCSARRRQR